MGDFRIPTELMLAKAKYIALLRTWRKLGIFWLVALLAWLGITILAWYAERHLGNARGRKELLQEDFAGVKRILWLLHR